MTLLVVTMTRRLSSGGSRISPGGAPTPKSAIILPFFGRKLHEIERIWTLGRGGGGVRGAPLRSANVMLHQFPQLVKLTKHDTVETLYQWKQNPT